jgi:cellulose biosynthesis protein BcsQ
MICAVTIRKGGAGKTALATNLAACYGQSMRTLLIDLDPQADSSVQFGIEDTGEALADALSGRTPLEAAIRETDIGIDVAPAGEALGYIGDTVSLDALHRALDTIRHRKYSAVIIDCAPGLDHLAICAWRASTVALAPVDGPRALRAVALLRHAWEDHHLDPSLIRIVMNRVDERRVLDRGIVAQTIAAYGDAVAATRIRESVVVGESSAWRVPLVLHAPTHWVTDDMRRLAREVYSG